MRNALPPSSRPSEARAGIGEPSACQIGERHLVAWVYIMASKPYETLYTGVTTDLARRVYEHREGLLEGFSNRYGTKSLVWYEQYDEIGLAIQREKRLKRWRRQWKFELIEKMNPDWKDLYLVLNQ